jgi:hypothetical protein
MWLLLRLLAMLVLLWVGGIVPSEAAAFPSFGLPALLVYLDRIRSHELLLHANLAASEGWTWAASLLAALTLDAMAFALLA